MMEEIGADVRTETHLRVCDSFRDLMDLINVVTLGLGNDIDPPPHEVAMCALAAIDDAGYRFVRVIPDPYPKISDES